MFTKSDLKNGDVIVRRNGNVEIAIVDLGVFVDKTGWNDLDRVNDDLTNSSSWRDSWDIVKVIRPNRKYHCQFCCVEHDGWGELVYDRERDVKPVKLPYNGKVVCIDLNKNNYGLYTVGKVYQFKDGVLTADDGGEIDNYDEPFYSFEDFTEFSGSKWIEIKE